jgi:hypothetical protein
MLKLRKFLLALLTLGQLWSCKEPVKKPANDLHEYEKPATQTYLETNLKYANENNFLPLKNVEVYLGNDSTKVYRLYDLLQKNTLIFKFSGKLCNSCIDLIIKKIKESFADFSSDKRILLIGSDLNPQVKDSYFGKPVISYKSALNMGLPIEEFAQPVLLITDKSGVSSMVFLPDATYIEFTVQYLQTLKNKFK